MSYYRCVCVDAGVVFRAPPLVQRFSARACGVAAQSRIRRWDFCARGPMNGVTSETFDIRELEHRDANRFSQFICPCCSIPYKALTTAVVTVSANGSRGGKIHGDPSK